MFARLIRGLRQSLARTLIAIFGAGALVLAYGIAEAYLATGTAPTRVLWLLLAPLATLVALLSGTLVAVWQAAPVLVAYRALSYLAERADEREKQTVPALDAPRDVVVAEVVKTAERALSTVAGMSRAA
jgi:hypothetical protein